MKSKAGRERISDEDLARLYYVRKSGDYPKEGTDEWVAWDALCRRVDRALIWTRREREAWHEAGHAVVGHRLGGHLTKITQGYTHFGEVSDLPWEVENILEVAGHVAEEMTFGYVDPSKNEASRIAWGLRNRRQRSNESATHQECRAYVEGREACAQAILEVHWSVVEAIAKRYQARPPSSFPFEQEELLGLLDGVPNGDVLGQ